MAKPKATPAAGQKSITSFFGRGSSSTTKEKKPAAKPKKSKVVEEVEDEEGTVKRKVLEVCGEVYVGWKWSSGRSWNKSFSNSL